MRQNTFVEIRDVNGTRSAIRRGDIIGVSEDPNTGRAVIILRGGYSLVVDDRYRYEDVRQILEL